MKQKIFEISYVDSDQYDLETRIEFYKNFIDYFIIIVKNTSDLSISDELKNRVRLVQNNSDLDNERFVYENLQQIISNFQIDFCDLLMFSSPKDYPNIKINLLSKFTNSAPVFHVLSGTYTKELYIGSVVVNYSQYVLNKNNFVTWIERHKNPIYSHISQFVEGGFYSEKKIEYKKNKVIDCFVFNDEIEMLKLRLSLLNNFVDKFILVESRYTHSGNKKSVTFDENKNFFADYLNKIEHIIVDRFPDRMIYPPSEIDVDNNLHIHWFRENFQRNEILRGLYNLDLDLDDFILISDVDEIPDPQKLDSFLSQIPEDDCGYQSQKWCIWDFDRFHEGWWPGTAGIKWKNMKKTTPQEIRKNRYSTEKFVTPDFYGWHCSWFGGIDMVMNKLSCFAHQELRETPKTEILRKMAMNLDIHGHQLIFDPNGYKPVI